MAVNAMYTGMTGLDSFGNAISIVSDNIANANTTGYKSNTALFGDLVCGYLATEYSNTKAQGAGSSLVGVETDFGTGPTLHTGTWSDVMLQGNGFFNVQNDNGQLFYTRDGSFTVNNQGYLVDQHGYQVIDATSGGAIQIEADPANPAYISYEIDKYGDIYGTLPNGAGRNQIGTLRISTFPNPQGLIRNGGNLYYPGSGAGAPVNGTASSGPCGSVASGAIEGSNVDLAAEMVNLILYQADYTANSKSIQTANNMLDTVVNMIR